MPIIILTRNGAAEVVCKGRAIGLAAPDLGGKRSKRGRTAPRMR